MSVKSIEFIVLEDCVEIQIEREDGVEFRYITLDAFCSIENYVKIQAYKKKETISVLSSLGM
jgi:hypothetical protein